MTDLLRWADDERSRLALREQVFDTCVDGVQQPVLVMERTRSHAVRHADWAQFDTTGATYRKRWARSRITVVERRGRRTGMESKATTVRSAA